MLKALYLVRDPWGMESPSETFRFSETNRLIGDQFGPVDRLLFGREISPIAKSASGQRARLRLIARRLTSMP
jgi:hypothetical protein